MSIDLVDRLKIGDLCVPMYYTADKNNGLKVGDDYILNYVTYKVKEICSGDLDGHCWIGK